MEITLWYICLTIYYVHLNVHMEYYILFSENLSGVSFRSLPPSQSNIWQVEFMMFLRHWITKQKIVCVMTTLCLWMDKWIWFRNAQNITHIYYTRLITDNILRAAQESEPVSFTNMHTTAVKHHIFHFLLDISHTTSVNTYSFSYLTEVATVG